MVVIFESKTEMYHKHIESFYTFLQSITRLELSWINYYDIEQTLNSNEKNSLSASELYQVNLYKTYIKETPFIPHYSEIFRSYIQDGCFSENQIIEYLQNIETFIQSRMQNRLLQLSVRLKDYKYLEDHELITIVHEIKNEIFAKKYSIEEYYQIIVDLCLYQSKTEISFDIDENFLMNFIDHAKVSIQNFRGNIKGSFTNPHINYPFVSRFIEAMEKESSILKSKAKIDLHANFWKNVFDVNNMNLLKEDIFNEEIQSTCVFPPLDCEPEKLVADLIALPNRKFAAFIDWFCDRYLINGFSLVNPHVRLVEETYLTQFKIELQRNHKTVHSKIKNINVANLISALEKGLYQINELKHNPHHNQGLGEPI
jgi:hypothetical protein